MTETVLLTTRDAAERLDVHARTIRKWIDAFEDYIQPETNERGHYMLNEDSIQHLKDIQDRLQEPNKTMKQVREELQAEGMISTSALRLHQEEEDDEQPPMRELNTEQTLLHMMDTLEGVGNLVEELFNRMDRLEDRMYSLFESLEDLEHKIAAVGYDTFSPSDVHQMFDEVRKKQEQLKIELRSVSFTQRFSTNPPTKEQNFLPRRQRKHRFFNLF